MSDVEVVDVSVSASIVFAIPVEVRSFELRRGYQPKDDTRERYSLEIEVRATSERDARQTIAELREALVAALTQ